MLIGIGVLYVVSFVDYGGKGLIFLPELSRYLNVALCTCWFRDRVNNFLVYGLQFFKYFS